MKENFFGRVNINRRINIKNNTKGRVYCFKKPLNLIQRKQLIKDRCYYISSPHNHWYCPKGNNVTTTDMRFDGKESHLTSQEKKNIIKNQDIQLLKLEHYMMTYLGEILR